MSVSLAPISPRRMRKGKRTGPTVSILILNAISSYGGSRGVSLVALKKVLKDSGYDVTRNRARIRLTLHRLVAKKVIVRTRGKGASGSFKVNPKPPGGGRRRPVRGARRSKRRRRGRGKKKKRKPQGRRTRRGRSRRRRRKATPVRKRTTRRRRRRAPRRKTPKRIKRVRRKRSKPAKIRRRRRSRMSGRVYK